MPKLKKNYTPEDVLKIREQARLRAKKFYDANKEKISLQKKEKWAAIMAVAPAKKSNIIKTQIVEPEILPVDEPFVFVEEEKNDEPTMKMKVKNGKLIIPINFDLAVKKINDLTKDDSSKKIIIDGLKTLLRITNFNDLRDTLKNTKKVISEIENSTYKNDPNKQYDINSKKLLFQNVLTIITDLKIDLKPSTIEKYKSKLEEYKILSYDKTEKKQASSDNVIDYKELMKKILHKFGVKSKQYLIARLYDEFTCRDNYGDLEIIENMVNINPNKNYILIPQKRITLILQDFKTKKAYKAVHHKVSDSLDTLIRSYITQNNLSYGDTLLGKTLLSKFIGNMLRDIGIEKGEGSINYLRHSKISTEYPDASADEKIKLSKLCQHSGATQRAYVRKLRDI
jgi:hypothetical protein